MINLAFITWKEATKTIDSTKIKWAQEKLNNGQYPNDLSYISESKLVTLIHLQK